MIVKDFFEWAHMAAARDPLGFAMSTAAVVGLPAWLLGFISGRVAGWNQRHNELARGK